MERFTVRGPDGRFWILGVPDGRWYYNDGMRWVPANAPPPYFVTGPPYAPMMGAKTIRRSTRLKPIHKIILAFTGITGLTLLQPSIGYLTGAGLLVFGVISYLRRGAPGAQHSSTELLNLTPCPKCGRMIPSKLKFCTYCGTKLATQEQKQVSEPEPPKQETVACSSCGHHISPKLEFCRYCGAKAETAQRGKERYVFCTKCGKRIPASLKFCTYCGQKRAPK